MAKTYRCNGLTGGSGGSLDSLDGTTLATGDVAFSLASGTLYCHVMDSSSGAAESSPNVISPDANAGNKRWLLSAIHYDLSSYTDVVTLDPADELLVSQSGINKSGTLAQLNTYLNANTSHDSAHIKGGGDEMDGDKIDIDFSPGYYTPTLASGISDDLDHLASHLKGIDEKFRTSGTGSVNQIWFYA